MPLSIHFIYSLFLCCTYLYIEYLFAYSYFRPIVKFTQVLWSWDMPTYSLCSNSHMALAWAVNALKRINYTCRLNEDNPMASLQWRHNERYCVWNRRHLDCLLNRSFRRRSTKTSKFRVIDFSRGIHIWPVNSPHKRPVTRKMLPFDEVIVISLSSSIDRPSDRPSSSLWRHCNRLDRWEKAFNQDTMFDWNACENGICKGSTMLFRPEYLESK